MALFRLGSLACFYGDAPTLNSSLSRKLLCQLSNCINSDVKEVTSSSVCPLSCLV